MLVAFQASIRHPNLFAHLVCWKFWVTLLIDRGIPGALHVQPPLTATQLNDELSCISQTPLTQVPPLGKCLTVKTSLQCAFSCLRDWKGQQNQNSSLRIPTVELGGLRSLALESNGCVLKPCCIAYSLSDLGQVTWLF